MPPDTQLCLYCLTVRQPFVQFIILNWKSGESRGQYHTLGRLENRYILLHVAKKTSKKEAEKNINLEIIVEHANVPVIFALSRRQLGAAIRKNVTISVLAIQDTRPLATAFAPRVPINSPCAPIPSM